MHRRVFFTSLVIFIGIFITNSSFGRNFPSDTLTYPPKRQYNATRIDGATPVIDGRIDDECWLNKGEWSGGFTQQQPVAAGAPSQPTEIKILYDHSNLYVAVHCMDSEPEKIRRIFGPRDNFVGDMTGIAIDSYSDMQTAYEFNLTCAGQKIDLMHIGAYQFDTRWNAVWDGATGMTGEGWVAEFKIPFSQLRYNPEGELKMGIHIWRWIDRFQEESQWQYIPLDAPAMVFLFGELKGIENIQGSRKVEMQPYLAAKYKPVKSDVLPSKPLSAQVGLDSKIGIASNFTVDLTVNPDFGQVEADPSVLNLTNYEVFYEEKRNFFLEGNNIYDFRIGNDRLFYSRRIGHAPSYTPETGEDEELDMPGVTSILAASKLTGRNKHGLSVGIIESITGNEFAEIFKEGDSRKQKVEPLTNYFVGRLKQEWNEGNTNLGIMLTSVNRSMDEDFLKNSLYRNSEVAGMDLLHYWNKKRFALNGKFAVSNITGSGNSMKILQESSVHQFMRPDADHLEFDSSLTRMNGTGGEIGISKLGGKWRANTNFNWRSPGFDMNDLGYMRQADQMGQESEISYVINNPGKYFKNYDISLTHDAAMSFGNELVGNELDLEFTGRLHNLWRFRIGAERNFSAYETRELRGGPALRKDPGMTYSSVVNTNYALDFMMHGSVYFYSSDNGLYDDRGVSGGFRLNILEKYTLSLTGDYSVNKNYSQYIGEFNGTEDKKYIVGGLNQKILSFTLRGQAHISPQMSFQYYGSPFLTTGRFSDFRLVSDPGSEITGERYTDLTSDQLNMLDNTLFVDYNLDLDPDTEFTNPDFNFSQFRSNFVFRWEYKLGSILYLVWSHDRTYSVNSSVGSQEDNLRGLLDAGSGNIIMLKFNYWFTL